MLTLEMQERAGRMERPLDERPDCCQVCREDDDRIVAELDRQAEPYGGDWMAMLRETSRPMRDVEDAVR